MSQLLSISQDIETSFAYEALEAVFDGFVTVLLTLLSMAWDGVVAVVSVLLNLDFGGSYSAFAMLIVVVMSASTLIIAKNKELI